MARRSFAVMVGIQLADQRCQADQGKRQENKAGYLQPQLMQHTREMAGSRSHSPQHRSVGSATLHLVAGNAGRNAQFTSCRDVCHSSRFYQ